MKHSLFKAIWPPSVFGKFDKTIRSSIGSDVNNDEGHTDISRDF